MNTAAATTTSTTSTNYSAYRWVLLGGFLAGLIDFLYPTTKAVMAGKPWINVWKGVAGGLLGPEARSGGLGTAAIGMAAHWFINIVAAFVLYFVVKNLKFIPRQWWLLAIIHGIAMLLAMNYVIVPLSAIGRSIYPTADLAFHALEHILVVGVAVGVCVSKALKTA